jgi:SAM-dependent methyltransferase
MPDPPADPAPWWPTFFDDDYARFELSSVSAEDNERIVDFLMEALQLTPGDRVLDQCCGVGRLSLALARRGLHVTGVDQAASYIEHARAAARDAGLDCAFHHGDALTFTAPEPCAAVINWFTSIGYAEDDEVNRRMPERAFESLTRGGRLLVEYQNFPRVLSMFQRSITQRPEAQPDTLIVQESSVDFLRGMMNSKWTFFHDDGRRVSRDTSTRVYMPHEIIAMLRRCGFEEIRLAGGYEGEPFGLDSRRCIVIGRRP